HTNDSPADRKVHPFGPTGKPAHRSAYRIGERVSDEIPPHAGLAGLALLARVDPIVGSRLRLHLLKRGIAASIPSNAEPPRPTFGCYHQSRGPSMDTYYEPGDLPKFSSIGNDAPQLWEKFQAWYGEVFKPGALSAREKSLIALAVAHAVQCPYCIDAYTDDCLQKGADLEQMTEAVHVATAIRGGASLVHGVQMLEQVERKTM